MDNPREAPLSAYVLDAMLVARRSMNACITVLDATLYTPKDRTYTENRMDRVIVEAISALRRLQSLRHGQNSGVP